MSFQIHNLPASSFNHLATMTDTELAAQNIKRLSATAKPGYPCRVSLQDAEIGETVYLLNYEHHKVDSPYRSNYAIFIRDSAKEAALAQDEIPPVLRGRPLAFRGFSQHGMLIHAALGMGDNTACLIEEAFINPNVAYIHIHNAMHGCFAAEARRA